MRRAPPPIVDGSSDRAEVDPFRARFLLQSAHFQTLGAALPFHASRAPKPLAAEFGRDEVLRFPLPGGGRLLARARWHPAPASIGPVGRGGRLTVLMLHGIAGSSESRYMLRAASSLYRAGFHVVRLNVRGAGDGLEDAPALYHAGLTEDPKAAVEALAEHPGVDGIALLGFSLGGGTMLRLAAEYGAHAPEIVRAVATVSSPLDLAAASRAIHRLRALPYRAYVVRGLVRQGLAFARLHPTQAFYDASALPRIRTIHAYDAQVVCPMHGFPDPDTYYAQTSAGPALPDIALPTLLVHAEDDPMVPADTVRPWLAGAPANVRRAWSDRGGHVGWFADLTERSWVDNWAMQQVAAFFRAHA